MSGPQRASVKNQRAGPRGASPATCCLTSILPGRGQSLARGWRAFSEAPEDPEGTPRARHRSASHRLGAPPLRLKHPGAPRKLNPCALILFNPKQTPFLDLLNRPRNPRLIGSMEGTQENPITVAAADHARKEPAVSLGTWVGRKTGH